jgi:hypothetical protein
MSPFPAPREEWKEETKEETKRRQRGARGSLSSGQDIVFENKMHFTLKAFSSLSRKLASVLSRAFNDLNTRRLIFVLPTSHLSQS